MKTILKRSIEKRILKGLARYYKYEMFNESDNQKRKDFLYKISDNLGIIIYKNRITDLDQIVIKHGSNFLVSTANNKLIEITDSIENNYPYINVKFADNKSFKEFYKTLKEVCDDYIYINGNSFKEYLCN